MHDVMLVLVVVAVIIALAIVATVLAIAVAVMVVFVRCLVAGMVTAFMASMVVVGSRVNCDNHFDHTSGHDVDLNKSSWNRVCVVSWSPFSWQPSWLSPSGAD